MQSFGNKLIGYDLVHRIILLSIVLFQDNLDGNAITKVARQGIEHLGEGQLIFWAS